MKYLTPAFAAAATLLNKLLLPAMLALTPLSALAAVPPEIQLAPIKLTERVYYFRGDSGMASAANKGFMSNAGFVITNDGVVVFDALGTPALGAAMLKAIRSVTAQPVRRIIVSHYHADHVYGLQALKAGGIEVWAHENGRQAIGSDEAQQRLAQRRKDLFPWVDDATRLVPADRWLSFKQGKRVPFELGGVHFQIIDASGAHSNDDLMLYVEDGRVLFAGDLYFTGRIPFVGNADSRQWLLALEQVSQVGPAIAIPGHGAASTDTGRDLKLTRDYLLYLRKVMGEAVDNMTGFEDAYRQTDWSTFEKIPAFEAANRLNAFGTYLLMERESLQKK